MFNVPISFRLVDRTSAAVIRSQAPVKNTTAPKTDVIDLSGMRITEYEGPLNFEMTRPSSHYIPQHLNEDGSWSLAQYIPYDLDGPLPDGAVPLPSPGDQELLDRLDRLADRLCRGFDARA